MCRILRVFCVLACVLPTPWAAAKEFPPVTDAERQLENLDWEPGAPAVVIYRDAELRFRDYVRDANSRLLVEERVKILTDEGVEAGVREIPHSRFLRLGTVEARTLAPDGSSIPVGEDAIFTERRSRSSRSYVTKVTFPSVTRGSILDLRFELFWDSFYYLDPWLFHQDLPVLRSEISYLKPDNLTVTTWGRQTGPQEFQVESTKAPGGMRIDIAMENLGALPNEPFSFPDIDLSSRFMVVPTRIFYSGSRIDLLSDWPGVCETFEDEVYLDFLKNQKRDVKAKAKELTVDAAETAAKVEKIFAFVRDEVSMEDSLGVFLSSERDAGDVLKSLSGSSAEKTLLLRALLDVVKVESEALWVADRREGGVVPDVPNPAWFTGVILRAHFDGRSVYLDPNDHGNAVGTLMPHLEGTIAVNCQNKKEPASNLPGRPAESNQRTARLKFTVDGDGALHGEGAMLLEGHAAWRRLGVYENDDAARDGWEERLGEQFPGFIVDDLTVEESVEQQQVTLRFKLTQREEDVLGDELSLRPSRPLGQTQPFALPIDKRRTPVLMPFGYSDQSVVELAWPEGWDLERLPQNAQHDGPAGRFTSQFTVNETARTLRYERSFSLNNHQFIGDEAYGALRELFDAASTSDVQEVLWLQP